MSKMIDMIREFNHHMKGRTYVFIALIAVAFMLATFGVYSLYSNSVSNKDMLRERVALAYVAEDAGMFEYLMRTDGGDTIAAGRVKANDCIKKDDGSDSDTCYASVRKIVQRLETRTETYSCGTTDSPQTCYRTVTEWVTKSDDTTNTSTVDFLGQKVSYDHVALDNNCGDWFSMENDSFWSSDQRYCYATVAREYEGVVGVKVSSDGVVEQFSEFKSGSLNIDEYKGSIVSSNVANLVFTIFGVLILLGIALTATYFIVRNDLIDGHDHTF